MLDNSKMREALSSSQPQTPDHSQQPDIHLLFAGSLPTTHVSGCRLSVTATTQAKRLVSKFCSLLEKLKTESLILTISCYHRCHCTGQSVPAS